jgi:hypothetical protein
MTQDVYVMRIWHNSGDSENWRVTVTDTRSQQKYNFANLDKLVDFLKERLELEVENVNILRAKIEARKLS